VVCDILPELENIKPEIERLGRRVLVQQTDVCKIPGIDAMVKGLTEELLDLKSIAMRLNKVSEERGRAELKMTRPAAPSGTSTVVVPKRPVTPQVVKTPTPEPAPEE
jgi:uncharacterized ferredoxin-like protein